ncbi:thioesterase [Deltaproteobacteria bacterium]|nr:thioesterase [Deltaproteobacteria bacterium]
MFTTPLQIYYEDTDLSGSVYHANYLRYFERAREHLLGPAELVRLWKEDGIGFVVYKCELAFREPAGLGDVLEIRTTVKMESDYRAVFNQSVWRPGAKQAMVEGIVQLVCVDRSNRLVALPATVRARIDAEGGTVG